jgi:hypothetical protein
MKASIYFANLKKALTGTKIGAKYALDVNVLQSVVPGGSGQTVLETRFHDTAVTQINNNAGAFVEIQTAAALANTIAILRANCTFGEPIQIRKGANAGAAAANPDLCILNRGEAAQFPVSLIAGDRIWVRALMANPVNGGELTINLMG